MSNVLDHIVLKYPPARRGFDDTAAWLPAFAVPELAENGEGVAFTRPPLTEDIRGSFAAISALSGFISGTLPCDPDDSETAEALAFFAGVLEKQARALRVVLEGEL